jgi:type VI secretion system secreted protein VgrG
MASQDFLTVGENQITLKMGNASIVLKADGSIDIRGVHINVEGSGRIQIKAFSDLTLKGARILEN